MRHGRGLKKLNRTKSHRAALLQNLAKALIKHGSIETTLPKAKTLRPYVEKMITLAKKSTLHSRRLTASRLRCDDAAKKLVSEVVPLIGDRPGGYTRIVRSGFRYGDNAPMAIIQMVDRGESSQKLPAKKVEEDDACVIEHVHTEHCKHDH
jgi:large subunit ribosomal protein L17